jgi:hypothetical protein
VVIHSLQIQDENDMILIAGDEVNVTKSGKKTQLGVSSRH